MPAKGILMLTDEFTEEYGTFVFRAVMEALGQAVHGICPDKKAGEMIATSRHDFEGRQTYTEKPGHNHLINKTFSEVKPEDYDAVYCAGGRGPEYIRTDPRIQAIVRHFHEAKAPIFTIGHGVQIPIAGGCAPEVALAGGPMWTSRPPNCKSTERRSRQRAGRRSWPSFAIA